MPITIIEEKKIFSLSGNKTEYIFAVDGAGLVKHLYWGEKISCLTELDAGFTPMISTNDPSMDLTPEEYPIRGGLRYREHCLEVLFNDGCRDLMLEYGGYIHDKNTLKINLADPHYPLSVTLTYRINEELDIIERSTIISNTGIEPFYLKTAASAAFNFTGSPMRLTNIYGHWASEQKIFRELLSPGKKVLESRKGTTAHNHGPFFILDENADEENGIVYFAALAYSGNFKVTLDVSPYSTSRAVIGINDFDFSWKLKGREKFTTPSVFCGFSNSGLGDMSRRMHSLALTEILPEKHREKIRPVLYNSWEATWFNITAKNQIALAEKAADMGAELYVLDDGWFGARASDNAGLGDWQVNMIKFPKGLDEIIEKVNSLGMEFGLWLEPEMVNPDSDLYRAHPDWIYNFKNRAPSQTRNQLVLNLSIPEVEKFITGFILGLLEKHNISFIKWDMNRPLSEAGALNLPADEQQMIWHNHTLAVYRIAEVIRKKFPEVVIEACASGGGRTDLGTMARFDQFWTSDNTDALDRLTILEGFSLLYPAKTMRAWVTDCPNYYDKRLIPLRYRFHSAMAGSLGIGCDLNKLTPLEIEESKKLISHYKAIRHIVQGGSLYRLSPIETGFAAVQYVLGNESVLLAFTRGECFGKELYPVCMRGLDEKKNYTIDIDGFRYDKSGEYLMRFGITIHLPGDYASKLITFTAK